LFATIGGSGGTGQVVWTKFLRGILFRALTDLHKAIVQENIFVKQLGTF